MASLFHLSAGQCASIHPDRRPAPAGARCRAARCRSRAAGTSPRPSHRGRTPRAGWPASGPSTNGGARRPPRSDYLYDYSYDHSREHSLSPPQYRRFSQRAAIRTAQQLSARRPSGLGYEKLLVGIAPDLSRSRRRGVCLKPAISQNSLSAARLIYVVADWNTMSGGPPLVGVYSDVVLPRNLVAAEK